MTTVPFSRLSASCSLAGSRICWYVGLFTGLRKTPIICGLLMPPALWALTTPTIRWMIMCLMALAFFGNGFASITWSLVSSLAPMRLIVLTGGVFNFAGGLEAASPFRWWWNTGAGCGFTCTGLSPPSRLARSCYICWWGDVKRVGDISTVEYAPCLRVILLSRCGQASAFYICEEF